MNILNRVYFYYFFHKMCTFSNKPIWFEGRRCTFPYMNCGQKDFSFIYCDQNLYERFNEPFFFFFFFLVEKTVRNVNGILIFKNFTSFKWRILCSLTGHCNLAKNIKIITRDILKELFYTLVSALLIAFIIKNIDDTMIGWSICQ